MSRALAVIIVRFIIAITVGAGVCVLAGFGLGKLTEALDRLTPPPDASTLTHQLMSIAQGGVIVIAMLGFLSLVVAGMMRAEKWVKQEDKLIDE